MELPSSVNFVISCIGKSNRQSLSYSNIKREMRVERRKKFKEYCERNSKSLGFSNEGLKVIRKTAKMK